RTDRDRSPVAAATTTKEPFAIAMTLLCSVILIPRPGNRSRSVLSAGPTREFLPKIRLLTSAATLRPPTFGRRSSSGRAEYRQSHRGGDSALAARSGRWATPIPGVACPPP